MTKKLLEFDDVLCLVIPEDVPDDDPSMIAHLDELAKASVMAQWRPGEQPPRVDFGKIEWLITGDVAKIDEFQPSHDCEQCRQGNDEARAFLTANPGRVLAMANIHYTEVWPAWSKL